MKTLTDNEVACRKILQARTGWGKLQAEAFVRELHADEVEAILACAKPEHAAAAATVLNDISDRVLARRPKPPKNRRVEPGSQAFAKREKPTK